MVRANEGDTGGQDGRTMRVLKRTIMLTVILLACAGVYSALRNLPISSGCSFYSECPDDPAKAEAPSVAAVGSPSESVAP